MTKFCTNCLIPISKKDQKAINLIKQEYQKNETPWYVGFSGGKDSSALLTLTFNALMTLGNFHKPVQVIYCDTGVEIPTISAYVKGTVAALKVESESMGLPLKFVTAEPKLDDRYFVKVIGRGYPPPTNIFRWCTDRLRINPVKSIIDPNCNSIVLLGIRLGESKQRDRTIERHNTSKRYYLTQGSSVKTKIFSPVIDYSINDVWSTIKYNNLPLSIDHSVIGQIYQDAGSECPVYKETKGTPCGKGHFGCWTCTVVRQDNSVKQMVENGHVSLAPLLEFRNWLAAFRDVPSNRCKIRRNGNLGLGPLTLEARNVILNQLFEAQRKSGIKLVTKDEINRITELWLIDKNDEGYKEN